MNGAFATPSWRTSTPSFAGTTQPDDKDLFAFGAEDKDKQNMFNVGDTELFKDSAATAQQQLKGETPGFEAQANEARESLIAQQKQRTQNVREGLLGLGLGQSGTYLEEGVVAPEQENYRERTAFERGLASDKASLGMQQQQAGQEAANNLLGQLTASQGQLADAAIREQSLKNEAMQFTSKQEWDTWATLAGLDDKERERIWQSAENQKGRTSEEKMFFANLSLDERKLAETAREFNSRQEFDTWAKEQDLAENEKQRIWQAVQNEKQLAVQVDIATMQNDTERWKQTRTEELTKAGWDHETAMQMAQQEFDATQSRLDRELQKDVEAGRLSLEEKKLAQQAAQFTSQQEFEKAMAREGYAQDAIARAWQSNENAIQRTHDSQEASLDRQLQKDVEAGRLSLEEKKLAEQTRQFNSQQEFQKWATEQGWAQDAIARAWQSGENAADRSFQAQQNALDRELQRYGLNLNAVMPYLQSLDGAQAASAWNAIAGAVGFTYKGADGQDHPGFAPADATAQATAHLGDVSNKLTTTGIVTETEKNELVSAINQGQVPDGIAVVQQHQGDLGSFMHDPPGKDGYRGWYLAPETVQWAEANKGKYVVINGNLYQVGEYYQPDGSQQNENGWISYRNVVSGEVRKQTVTTED